jgi:hypothetical protein
MYCNPESGAVSKRRGKERKGLKLMKVGRNRALQRTA